jgi:hypothetical protein
MRELDVRWVRPALLGGLFLGSFAIALGVLTPLSSASIGPDAAAPVIHFQHLLDGQRLEGYLSQTAKPLLTAVYGPIYTVTGDWRPVVWAALAAFALSVVLATVLTYRVANLQSAAFVAIALTLSPILLRDLSLAYAVSWSWLCCLIAGLMVARERPRFELAGIALGLGALARPELLSVIALAGAIVVMVEVIGRARGAGGPPRSAYLVLLGLFAVPVLIGHDWALTGDPFFWINTSQANSAGGNVRSGLRMVRFVGAHLLAAGPLIPLAILGAVQLLRRRHWALGAGFAAMVVGMSLFWIVVGARGTVVVIRYLDLIDLAIVVLAGLGLGAIDVEPTRGWAVEFARRHSLPRASVAAGGVVLAGAAALFLAPIWPTHSDTRAYVSTQVRLHANAQRALAAIRTELRSNPAMQQRIETAAAGGPIVLIPPRLRAQAVLDLQLPLAVVVKPFGHALDLAAGRPAPGSIIYHDRLDDPDTATFTRLEVGEPANVGAVRLVPLLVDPAAGFWVLRVDPPAPP